MNARQVAEAITRRRNTALSTPEAERPESDIDGAIRDDRPTAWRWCLLRLLVRLTFTPNPDGTLRQYSDYSTDKGASWKFRYDYLYKRMQ